MAGLKFTHTILPTSDITFDDTNPRIFELLAKYPIDKITSEHIGRALRPGNPSFVDLQEAIRSFGGVINPIKVNNRDGKKTVFEGNTRLAIYRDFETDNVPGGDWKNIPCVLYEDLDNQNIHHLRLQDHLIGPRDWPAYAKARYLHDLYHKENMPLEDLVSLGGGNKTTVLNKIRAYQMMEGPYRETLGASDQYDEEDDFEPQTYSIFEVYQQRKVVEQAISEAGYDDYEFCKWVADGKFKRLEHARELPKILNDDTARKIFLNKNSDDAIRYLGVDIQELVKLATLPNLCKGLTELAARGLKIDDLQLIRSNREDIDAIYDCIYTLENFVANELTDDQTD